MKIYHGIIITLDKNNNRYSYLVENKGYIEFVGNDLPTQYNKYEIIELNDKALIPSFADTHMHFASYATFHAGLNVMNASSNVEILNMLKEYVSTCKDKMILAFGASPYSVKEGKLVTREQLDSVCPNKPVFMIKYDGHTCVINTALLNKVKHKIKHLRGYHEDTGEMNQDAFFAVSNYVTNSIPIIQLIKNMQNAMNDLAKQGIGMVHSVSGVGFTGDLDVDLENWFSKGLSNGMQLRVYMQTLNVNKALKRGFKCIGGCFESALDGCFGSIDAAMNEPYENTDNKGVLYYSDEKVIEFAKRANRANLQIEIHAIGDAAFDQATKALKAALDDYPRSNHRHAIIHACLPTKEGIQICKDYNITLPIQSAFIDWKQEPDSYLEDILGDRVIRLNPFKDYVNNNILLSAGSDAPCTEPNPIEWIYKACNHTNNSQALSIEEALKMCTYNGYYTSFDDHLRGSLEINKIADMVILNRNPFELDIKDLNQLKVEELLLKGKPYQPITINPILHILKGMLKK